MFKPFVFCLSVVCLSFADFGEAIKCYHCYDSYTKTLTSGSFEPHGTNSSAFIRCDKNKNKWNSWDCPAQWPVCLYMSGSVKDHYEVIRSCAEKNFCSNVVPPNDVKLENCMECNTTLCNDYPHPAPPDLPDGPGPLFVFNINVNLNLRKSSSDNDNGKL